MNEENRITLVNVFAAISPRFAEMPRIARFILHSLYVVFVYS